MRHLLILLIVGLSACTPSWSRVNPANPADPVPIYPEIQPVAPVCRPIYRPPLPAPVVITPPYVQPTPINPPVITDPPIVVDPPVVENDLAGYLETLEYRVEKMGELVPRQEVIDKAGDSHLPVQPGARPGTSAWRYKVIISGQKFDYEVIVDSKHVLSVEGPV